MSTYGYRITLDQGDGSRWPVLREIEAPDRRTAEIMIDGWATVEGKTVASRELIAEGMTFREAGERRALEIAGHLRTRYGATVEGPFIGAGESIYVRVALPNGKGISLATGGRGMYDPAPSVEAYAFDERGFMGDPVRSVDVEWCASMMDDLK